ncbi:MAG: ferrous iron transport protein A [Rhodospirillales bacterium]|nr:ferrous iron transport protein A [Rhodospirillales bacterium]
MEKIVSNDASRSPGNPVFPLADAIAGDRLIIASFHAGKEMNRRLADLGLPIGAQIEVVNRQRGGRMVIARNLSRVALGAGMTDKIMVTRTNGPSE